MSKIMQINWKSYFEISASHYGFFIFLGECIYLTLIVFISSALSA